ncbi:MAG: AMP-binding protein [Lachnospiraceae bacterium]|nr:AMP-binding protein [Lachnospiraceae bacterium]
MWKFDENNNNPALIGNNGDRLSYARLGEECRKLTGNIDKRSLVFVLCKNTVGCVVGYAGFINAHIVPVMLNEEIPEEQLKDLIARYEPPYMWVPSGREIGYIENSTIYEAFGYKLLRTCYDTENIKMYDGLALLLTTSGSTGSPKFVRQSYDNILVNARSIVSYLELDETERPITTLPMNYTYGLSIINSHLLTGATLLLTEYGLMQKGFWEFFREYGATSIAGVPYTYEMLDRLRFFRMDLPTLRYMTQAGGKLLPDLHEKFALYARDKGIRFYIMYGQCEATARMGYLPYQKAVEKKGAMGIAIPGGRFHLIDVNGDTVTEPETVGELVYEGANVTLGYAEKKEDLLKGDERNGVLVTGDMAQFDKDGYYYIVGRKKRFLKIYGNRVNLDEMERKLKAETGADCAVGGKDDHMVIFVTDPEMQEALRDRAIKITRLNPAAFYSMAIPEIPKNDAGKTQYRELEKYYVD